MVTVVWESWLKSGDEAKGLELTRQIWFDMLTRFEGYVSHRLLVDEDNAGHLLVVSQWQNREAADRSKQEYAGSETVRQLTQLLSRPRERWIFREEEARAK